MTSLCAESQSYPRNQDYLKTYFLYFQKPNIRDQSNEFHFNGLFSWHWNDIGARGSIGTIVLGELGNSATVGFKAVPFENCWLQRFFRQRHYTIQLYLRAKSRAAKTDLKKAQRRSFPM